jgi:predicted ester cyclase
MTDRDSSARNKESAVASFRAIETDDAALAGRIVDASFRNREAADDPEDAERNQHGPAGFLATARWLRQAFSDLHFEIREIVAEDDRVIVASTMRGRHTGVFQGAPPTGRAFRQEQVHIFRLARGMIVEHRAVRDDLGMLFGLGWRLAKPPP